MSSLLKNIFLENLFIILFIFLRWDASCMDQLQDYMQPFYHILLDVLNEVEEEMIKQGRSYRAYHAKEIVCMQLMNIEL